MKRFFFLVAALSLSVVAFSQNIVKGSIENAPRHETYVPTFKSDGSKKLPKNVILMIGDGMGFYHVASGYYANGGSLTLTNLKAYGWSATQSADNFITDSAASGTAYACGIKTDNYSVGVDCDKRPVPNIPELVAAKGIISGVVSTDDLNGATPASFFAHQDNRGMTAEIWADLPGSVLSFWSAGSQEKFAEQSEETQAAVRREFTVVTSLDDPAAKGSKKLGYLPTAKESGYIKDGRTDFLPVTTKYAIDYLNDRTARRKGFFLMVEGARIDKAAHNNVYDSMVLEMLDFDQAIEAAIRFADENGETLVIITADHETGATVIWDGDPAKGNMTGVFTSGWHTGAPVPVFAYGPHSQDFTGMLGNDEIARRILSLLLRK